MPQPSHVRVVSLVLALSIVTGGWLLLAYSQRSPQQHPLIGQRSEPTQESALSPERTVFSPPKAPNPVTPAPPKNLIMTFKCEQGGRVSYGDQTCANGAKTLAVTAAQEVLAQNPTTNLQKMKAQAAAMEADRQARERQFEIAAAEAATVSAPSGNTKIDQAIASIEATLRQPHGPQEGDFWTAKRWELTDRRFSAGC